MWIIFSIYFKRNLIKSTSKIEIIKFHLDDGGVLAQRLGFSIHSRKRMMLHKVNEANGEDSPVHTDE